MSNQKIQQKQFICQGTITPDGQIYQLVCAPNFPQSVTQKSSINQKLTHQTIFKNSIMVSADDHNCKQNNRNCKVPSTKEIYTLWESYPFFSGTNKILETVTDFCINPYAIVPGTTLKQGSLVYGYESDKTTLNLTGGTSYNPDFTEFKFRHHTVEPALISPQQYKDILAKNISYYTQRGFQLPAKDIAPQYQGMYSSITGGYAFGWNVPIVYMKFAKVGGKIKYLDLMATNTQKFQSIGLYEPNINDYENTLWYPIRIPITKNCRTYEAALGSTPIVYYDEQKSKITISVPDLGDDGHFLGSNVFDQPYPGLENISFVDYLKSFEGTFSLMKREKNNQVRLTDIECAEYIVQCSSQVNIKNYSNASGLNVSGEDTFTRLISPPNEDVFLPVQMNDPLATTMKIKLTWDDYSADIDLYLISPSGEYIASSASAAYPEGITVDISNVSPKTGEYMIEIYHWDGPATTYTAEVKYGTIGAFEDLPSTIEYQSAPNAPFSGMVCTLLNGGNSNFDLVIYGEEFGGWVNQLDPYEYQAINGYNSGDNQNTTFIENFANPSAIWMSNINYAESSSRAEYMAVLPTAIILGDISVSYPEIVSTLPVPVRPSAVVANATLFSTNSYTLFSSPLE